MNYTETLQTVDTLRALKLLNIETEKKGAYIYFPAVAGMQRLSKHMGRKRMFFIAQNVTKVDILSSWF